MSNHDSVSRMLDKLREKTAKSVWRRADIYIADYRLLSNTSAYILFGYDNQFGVPSVEDIQTAVVRDFEGRITPALSTAEAHPDYGAVKVIADMVLPTRPYNDSNQMVAVANTVFIDQEMGQTWDLVEGADGIKYLQRKTEDDIGEILKARKQRMMSTASVRGLEFGEAINAGVEAAVGDHVRFYADSAIHSGEVFNVGLNKVAVKTDAGNYEIAPEAVLDRIYIAAEAEELDKKKLREYYAKIYGPEYADKLVGPHPE